MPINPNIISLKDALKLEGLPDTICFTTFAEMFKLLAKHSIVEIPSSISNVIVSNVQPSDTERSSLWFRTTNGGDVIGLYLYSSGTWRPFFPVPGELVRLGPPHTSTNLPFGYELPSSTTGYTAPMLAAIMATWLPSPGDPSVFEIFDVVRTPL